jgi:hypothetical protein
MIRPNVGFHPSFDELSAHADRADTDTARSRVGRHVAGCVTCRETLAEIRALGDAVRASEVAGAPAGLWARIERAMDVEGQAVATDRPPLERVVPVAASRDGSAASPAGSVRRGVSRTARRASLGLVLLVAATAAVVALDAREPLAAATPRRLRADRDVARPGSAITFHYRPIASLADERSLTMWMLMPGKGETRFDQALERAGTLHRVSALDFTGSVVMPDSTPLAMFVVGDSAGETIDRSEGRAGRLPSVVLAADSLGRPRLDAFVMALGGGRGSPDSATMFRWAKQMRELYPSAPETWILGSLYTRRTVIGDIVKLFESRERQYYDWHDRLEKRADVSEVTEVMMANMGWELMDTARADFWTTRLLRDHPDSPSAPSLWIDRFRDVPDDSAAIVLRAFEPIYLRPTTVTGRALERALMLADRSGDSALARRWHARVDPRNISWLLSAELTRMAGDREALSDVRRRLLEALAEADSAEHGGPTLWGRSRFFAMVQRQRVRTRLAAVRLVEGDARGAKTALDSIVGEWQALPSCPTAETMRWRAEASRTLGLPDSARADLAYVATTENWQLQRLGDSVATILGSAYSAESWDAARVAARAYHQRCFAAGRDAQRRTTR